LARIALIGLILVPIVEIALLIKVGQTIGLLWTLGLLIAATLGGALLLRLEGLAVIGQMRASVETGRLPARTVADAIMIGLAAVLLVLPGFLSDILAIALLLPPVRSLIYAALSRRMVVVDTGAGSYQDPRVRGPRTIDLDDEDYRQR
jgi:Protein affecting phage T7 exclusion by the F plasmid